MQFAQMKITGPGSSGSTHIDLTYSYWADNTWYCPSVGKIGATTGTWDVGRNSGKIYLYSGEDSIATADSVGMPDMTGYPFNDDMMNMVTKFTVMSSDAEWGFARYAWASTLQYCTWQFNYI